MKESKDAKSKRLAKERYGIERFTVMAYEGDRQDILKRCSASRKRQMKKVDRELREDVQTD